MTNATATALRTDDFAMPASTGRLRASIAGLHSAVEEGDEFDATVLQISTDTVTVQFVSLSRTVVGTAAIGGREPGISADLLQGLEEGAAVIIVVDGFEGAVPEVRIIGLGD